MRGRWGHDAGHVKGGGLGLGDGVRQVPLAPPRENAPLHIKDADVDGVRVRALLVYSMGVARVGGLGTDGGWLDWVWGLSIHGMSYGAVWSRCRGGPETRLRAVRVRGRVAG
jgi:hypothetical protein